MTACDRDEEAPSLAHQLALLFLEGTELAGVVQRVADIAQHLQQLVGADSNRVVFDQRLLVRQAYRHLVDTCLAAQRLLDGAGAERAVEPADARPDVRPVRAARRLLGPERVRGECCRCCGGHGDLPGATAWTEALPSLDPDAFGRSLHPVPIYGVKRVEARREGRVGCEREHIARPARSWVEASAADAQ